MRSDSPQHPPPLPPGGTIGIAAPSAGFPADSFAAGLRWIQARGYRVRHQADIFERHHYLAGSKQRRLDELHALFQDQTLDALFFARGGYGVMHLLPDLDLHDLARRPRIILGCSDLTPLLNLIVARLNLITFHGPMICGLHKTREQSLTQMLEILTHPTQAMSIQSAHYRTLCPGSVTAPLCGGNLSLIAATMGTPFELETRGRILCLEDVGERPYQLDRLLQQLSLAGKLEEAAGIAIGELIDCEEPGGRGRPLDDLLDELLGPLSIPVVSGMPFGHGGANDTLPLGATAELVAEQGRLHFLAPAEC